MWNSVKQEWKIQRSTLLFLPILSLFVWLLGVGLMIGIVKVLKADGSEYVYAGTMLNVGLTCLVAVILEAQLLVSGFTYAVWFGKSRKRYLLTIALLLLLTNIGMSLEIFLLEKAEEILYRAVFPEAAPAMLMDFLLKWGLILAVFITGAACFGGGMLRFNRRVGGGIVFLVWIVCCCGCSGIFKSPGEEIRGFDLIGFAAKNFLLSFSPNVRALLLIGAGAAGIGIMYLLLMKKEAD